MKKHKILNIIIIIGLFIILGLGIYGFLAPQKIAVLGYHSFYKTETETKNAYTMDIKQFDEQMRYLYKKGFKTLSMSEYYNWKQGKKAFPKKTVVITFDDGYVSNYIYAFDVLKKYDFKGTVFIIGSYVNCLTEDNNNAYLSKEQIKEAKVKYPNIEFASHTFNLHDYGVENKTYDAVSEDIKLFNQLINTKYHAYPFGLSNEIMKKAYKDNGYKLAFDFGPDFKDFRKSSRKDDNYNIPRISIDGNMKMFEYKLRINGPF